LIEIVAVIRALSKNFSDNDSSPPRPLEKNWPVRLQRRERLTGLSRSPRLSAVHTHWQWQPRQKETEREHTKTENSRQQIN